jgi:hypothetical protein
MTGNRIQVCQPDVLHIGTILGIWQGTRRLWQATEENRIEVCKPVFPHASNVTTPGICQETGEKCIEVCNPAVPHTGTTPGISHETEETELKY